MAVASASPNNGYRVDIDALNSAANQVSDQINDIQIFLGWYKSLTSRVELAWKSPAGNTFSDAASSLQKIGSNMVDTLHGSVDKMHTTANNYVRAETTNTRNLRRTVPSGGTNNKSGPANTHTGGTPNNNPGPANTHTGSVKPTPQPHTTKAKPIPQQPAKTKPTTHADAKPTHHQPATKPTAHHADTKHTHHQPATEPTPQQPPETKPSAHHADTAKPHHAETAKPHHAETAKPHHADSKPTQRRPDKTRPTPPDRADPKHPGPVTEVPGLGRTHME